MVILLLGTTDERNPVFSTTTSSNVIPARYCPWSGKRVMYAYADDQIPAIDALFQESKTLLPGRKERRIIFLEVDMISGWLLGQLRSAARTFANERNAQVIMQTRGREGHEYIGRPVRHGRVQLLLVETDTVKQEGVQHILAHMVLFGSAGRHQSPEDAASDGVFASPGKYDSIAFLGDGRARVYQVQRI